MKTHTPIAFSFEDAAVRIISDDGSPWFVATDVCEILGISNTTQALQRLDDDERSMFNIGRSKIHGGGGEVNIINESGLYSLILRSRKPEAKRFRKWVTGEVLPSIRRNGSYGTLTPADEIRYLNQRLSLLQALQRSRDAVMRQEIYDQYRHVSERLGFAVPALSAFRPPDDNDALDDLTRATLAQFFQAVATLEDAAVGYHLNHHREAGVLALNLNEVMRAAEASGVPLPHRSALLRALPQSRAPRFIGASVTVNSALATPDKPRYVRCYLFKCT